MTIEQTIDIPVDRRISLKLPLDVPVGKARIIILTQSEKTVKSADDCVYENCPLYAEKPSFNAVTLAAMQEARDMANGKIPGKWYQSIDEARKDLEI